MLQVEAVSRCLVDAGLPVRDLAGIFTSCPQLLWCPAEKIRQRVGQSAPNNSPSCTEPTLSYLSAAVRNVVPGLLQALQIGEKLGVGRMPMVRLINALPSVLADDRAHRRLMDAAELLRRCGADASAFSAIALKAPDTFGMQVCPTDSRTVGSQPLGTLRTICFVTKC
jgi:hypothetical protein